MEIWVDADACPNVIKDILFRAAKRTKIHTTLVANHELAAFQLAAEIVERRRFQTFCLAAAYRDYPAQFLALFAHVAHLGTVGRRTVVRHVLQFLVADGDGEAVAESL